MAPKPDIVKPRPTPKPKPDPKPEPTGEDPNNLPDPVPNGQKLAAVKFVVNPSSSRRTMAICVGGDATGTSNVLVRNIYAGYCNVSAEIGGQSYSTTLNVTKEGVYNCELVGARLSCK